MARASRQLIQLGVALVCHPMDRRVHQRMRLFLDTESEQALASWEALMARTPQELRERIRTVITAQGGRREP